MNESEYYAISPLDGRYAKVAKDFAPFFSEYALAQNRVKIEVEWLMYIIKLLNTEENREDTLNKIKNISEEFNESSFSRMKEIEAITNHDTKSAELYVAEELKKLGLEDLISLVHIGCTSEDISNSAYAIMISNALKKVWIPKSQKLIDVLYDFSIKYAETPMLAHTHGQPATPTTVGKEFAVFKYRLQESLEIIEKIEPKAKFSGATGNYSAISVAYPEIDWIEQSKRFVEECLKLEYSPVCTQIETHDYVCRLADEIKHFDNIILDLDRDMWIYISMNYFKLKTIKTEVGSSTMPHKVNPIKFENSEGNIKIANAICQALSDNLPCSRMQRDLSDSTLQRNIGMAFGYSYLAVNSCIEGLGRVEVNNAELDNDLNSKWEVLAEPIQTVLRKYGIKDAYDRLKDLTRGKEINQEVIQDFIKQLEIPENDKNKLLNLTPKTYIGLADKIAKDL